MHLRIVFNLGTVLDVMALLEHLAAGGIGHHLSLRSAIGNGGRGGQFAQVVIGIAGGNGAAA